MFPQRNTLFYGDNLNILRQYIPDESVDLVYLDPPFNSNRNYNVLFKNERGVASEAQVQAFVDTWHWSESAERAYYDLSVRSTPEIASVISAFRQFMGTSQMMAYLVMMGVRLAELHRVLKPTGSLYLHCDPTASHYLKIILDTVFGPTNYQNELVWKRTSAHNDSKRFGRVHDTILFYSKSPNFLFKVLHNELDSSYVSKVYNRVDENGRQYRLDNISAPGGRGPVYEWGGITRAWRYTEDNMKRLHQQGRIRLYPNGRAMINGYVRYLDESKGRPLQDWWDDIGVIAAPAAERLGYPTQKPVALLERIISASTQEGDVCLDAFCGCGTSIAAAQKLNRRWIGIDITHLSIALQKYRLSDSFGQIANQDYDVIGEPADLDAAGQLAQDNRYQFQWWALSLVQGRPVGGDGNSKKGKKGADQGIDGTISFFDDPSLKIKNVLIQVKSGKVSSRDIRDLRGVLDREGAPMGVFITLESPSAPMIAEAASMGFYHSPGWKRDFPRLQIFTIEELLNGRKPELPNNVTFAKAPKVKNKAQQQQADLFMFQE